ncbi:receptor-like protein 6 [Pistacia vera]|uniref:receptor-like protein 6 n=1 Tax=Pistacia vera TaxID=55513 RepID=UPI001263D633|nr:receptor-like protein 6 [Pistacia vera]
MQLNINIYTIGSFLKFEWGRGLHSSLSKSATVHPLLTLLLRYRNFALQSSALLRFKNTFSIEESSSFSKTNSWKEGSDCCTWDGVTCDRFTGHVIGLDLSSSGLTGPINDNSSLFHLHHLQKLNLAYNIFDPSTISPKFGQFTKLTHLNLSVSSFYGLVPTEIFHLSKLVLLDLSYSRSLELRQHGFKKLLQNMTELRYLHLDSVNMSSVAVGSFANLPSSLISLSLQSNYMQGKLPDTISNLMHLNDLRLSGCKFEGSIPPSLENLTEITFLDLSFNGFTSQIPTSISKLDQLTHLNLGDNKFSGSLPSSLENLTEITSLELSFNGFTGQIPTSISKLGQLTHLDLGDNKFSGSFPLSLENLTEITSLDLSSNGFTGQIPTSISKLGQLTYLDLRDNKFSGSFPLSLENLTEITSLDLSSNGFTGQIPTSISKLGQLTFLYL